MVKDIGAVRPAFLDANYEKCVPPDEKKIP